MKKLILLTAMLLSAFTMVMADNSQYKKIDLSKSRSARIGFDHYKPLDLPGDSIKPGSRFTLSTNLLEWAIVAPNIGLEYDLKDPQMMSSPSIYFQLTWRPGQHDLTGFGKEYAANNITFWRARFEYRWHFRFNERKEQRKGLAIPASWINEHWFTKSEETFVPDTAAINAGDEFATMAIKSKQPAIDRKIDSTMVSTLRRKQNMFPGRWYAGIFGDVYGYDFNQKLDWFFFGGDAKGKNKIGNAAAAGLSAGYDFPGFNYNHKFFMQWSVGASIGGVFAFRNDVYEQVITKDNNGKNVQVSQKNEGLSGARFIPMPITELRVALNFRNTTISQKYWQPDNKVYEKNIMENRDDSIHMAELDSVLEQNPVVIQVHSVNGIDSAYTEVLDKMSIVRAFQQTTGLTYLLPQNFNVLPVTQNALNKKELSDNYFVEYFVTNRLRNYEDSVFDHGHKNLKFAIEIAGRAEADSLLKSFKDSLTKYYEANNSRPVFYGEPATKDSLKGFISKDSIAAEFSRIWGHTLDTTMIRALYMNRTVMNDDGTTTNFLDSIIGDTAINRGGTMTYGMFIQFHPQVTISAEDFGVARFRVGMAGADDARALYNNVASYYNSLAKIGVPRIQRSWNFQNDSFPNRVTKEEVLALFQKQGLEGNFDMDRISLNSDSIFTFNNLGGSPDTLTFSFGVTENPLSIPFVIEDSVGKADAQKLYQAMREWYASTYWQYLPDDDPIVPGYYNEEEDQWYVHTPTFIKVLSEIEPLKDVTMLPQQVDSAVQRVPRNSRTGLYQANRAGYYRAYAQVLFHREVRGRDGKPLTMRFPYQIQKMESMEDAGFKEDVLDENGNPLPKPEFIGPSYKKVGLMDEMGKTRACMLYTEESGEKLYVEKTKDGYKKVKLFDGDYDGVEDLSPEQLEWVTPKPFFRDEDGELIPAVWSEQYNYWINPEAGKKKIKPEMIGPSFTTEELFDEMGKAHKVNIYTMGDSAATKLRVVEEGGTFRGVTLDEFGDFGGTEELSDSIVNWLTPKPFFRDSLGTLIPAQKDSLGAWIDPFAVVEEAAKESASEAVEEAAEETVDLESMTPKERKAYEKQKAAEAKAKAKAEAAAKKKAEADAKAAAKKAAAEAKKNKGKKTVEAAAETVSAAADSLVSTADSAFNNLANTIQNIADSIPGVNAEVVTLPAAEQSAADVLTDGVAAVADSAAQVVEKVVAPVLTEKERKALEKKQAAEAKARAKAEAAAAKKAAAEAKKAEAEAKKRAAAEAKAAAAAAKKAEAEAKKAAKNKVEEKVEEAASAAENAAEQAAEAVGEAEQSVADILTGGNAEPDSTPAENTETTTEE